MRKLILLTSAGGALALIGGTAGAVAAVVAHTATPAPSATSTLFFPTSGQNANPPGNAGSASAGGAATSYAAQGAMAVPQAADSQAIATRGAAGYVYPSPTCGNAPALAQVQSDGITATGMVQLPLTASQGESTTLNVGVQSNGDGDVKSALTDVRQRLATIHDAIRAAGIPESAISQQGFNVWANGNPKPAGANVNGNLSVTIADAAAIDRVINAAVNAGANNLNLWSSSGNGAATPSDAQVHDAITKATTAAHGIAEAEAQGAGLTLGSVHAISAQPPSLCPWAPGGPQLVVAVTVTYAIK
jgi:uncharacterized protein YggE